MLWGINPLRSFYCTSRSLPLLIAMKAEQGRGGSSYFRGTLRSEAATRTGTSSRPGAAVTAAPPEVTATILVDKESKRATGTLPGVQLDKSGQSQPALAHPAVRHSLE